RARRRGERDVFSVGRGAALRTEAAVARRAPARGGRGPAGLALGPRAAAAGVRGAAGDLRDSRQILSDREGRLLHQLVAELVIEAKRRIYQHGAACLEALEALHVSPVDGEPVPPGVSDPEGLRAKLAAVRAYEARRVVERVQDVLARQPQAGADAIVALALPVHVEVKLNGGLLGLSARLSTDGYLYAESMVADLKFGPREEFHRLTTAGYALVLESIYEVPIDVGCIVYVGFRNGRVTIERDFHVIGDELRHWFLEEREEKMRLVAEEVDPGLPNECPRTCPYLRTCHPAERGAATPAGDRGFANLPVD